LRSRPFNARAPKLGSHTPFQANPMSRLDMLPDRALQLASQVGDNLKHMVPAGAGKWLDAGVKLGAVKAGTRVAAKVVRRNPVAFAAVATGAGLLWLVARQRAKRAENGNRGNGAGEGQSRRVEAKRGNGKSTAARKPRARKAATRSGSSS
jgi:hypothetical protein